MAAEPQKAKTMEDVTALERRITAALARIAGGLGQLESAVPVAADVPPVAGPEQVTDPEQARDPEQAEALAAALADVAQLQADLAAERAALAQLTAELDSLRARDTSDHTAQAGRIDQLTRQLDVQGLEMSRLRKSTIQLREALRALREAGTDQVDGSVINKAMLAELEALRALRASESQELDEIIAELVVILGPEVEVEVAVPDAPAPDAPVTAPIPVTALTDDSGTCAVPQTDGADESPWTGNALWSADAPGNDTPAASATDPAQESDHA